MIEHYIKTFFNEINPYLKTLPVSLYKIPQSAWSFLVSSLFYEGILNQKFQLEFPQKKPLHFLIFVLPTQTLAKQIYEEIQFFLKKDYVFFFGELDGLPYEWTPHDLYLVGERIRTLHAILHKENGVIITTVRAITKKIIEKTFFQNHFIPLQVGGTIHFQTFLEQLTGLGYRQVSKVENLGEFSLKGEIIDIYPVHMEYPIRIDCFDVEIESIRSFDHESQKSIKHLQEVIIFPVAEIVLTKDQFKALKQRLLELPNQLRKPDWLHQEVYDHYNYVNSRELIGLMEVVGFKYPLCTILDYFSSTPFIIYAQEEQLKKQIELQQKEYEFQYNIHKNETISLPPDELLESKIPFDGINHYIFIHNLYNLDGIKNSSEITLEILKDTEKFLGKLTSFRNYLYQLIQERATIVISSSYEVQVERIHTFLKNEQISTQIIKSLKELQKSNIHLIQSDIIKGFSYPKEQFYFFTDSDIFGKIYHKKFKHYAKYSSPLDTYLDLKEGDYVVHVNYGIGKFLRLEHIKAGGRERDCLVIEYADKDILYVPLDQISLIQRYLSPEENPKLDHLGKASFKKVKERVEKHVEEFAKELLELYAARMELKGFSFLPDNELQEEFEREFPYEETPDQIRAIEDVKRDMESDRPMDRLVCGDVGYGKTEVAIRALFKCVMSGKQAAVICPTTILARQHYLTFKERFKNYPVRIDWISSLRSQQEIKKVKELIKQKKVDIIIGTHALLSKDVEIPDLGLLVIDEEQRFGVSHKEQLKKLKKTVDVLTLSATPIPRTLHMSLIGIRDLSIINTPPKERKPVETYVLEYSDAILKEAILRELQRGGQIYYLHNRIKTLNFTSEKIRSLVPDIRIAILHSKLNDHDIDTILSDFIDNKYDLLLSTTIIENGIDIPNVNTLIVDEADKFGLSQLYQLRGRVGRSNRQAYAYFFHQGKHILTEEAQKRLNTLMEYQELGSGFKIAMRDLEIRGAGNILGKEQSGDIIEVGYELYLKLLENAIRKLRGEQVVSIRPCMINFNFDFYLSENYIKDTRQRIEFYKKFESASSIDQYKEIVEELQDRFGTPDPPSKIYLLLEQIRTLGTQLGIESITENNGTIQLQPTSHFKVPIDKLLKLLKEGNSFYLKPGNTKHIFYDSLRLRYLKKHQLKYEDIKITLTEEDLKHFSESLMELVKLSNENFILTK